jgi:hypothetical protein
LVDAATLDVVMVKGCDTDAPKGIVIDGGTEATEEFELLRVIAKPLDGAGPLSATVF